MLWPIIICSFTWNVTAFKALNYLHWSQFYCHQLANPAWYSDLCVKEWLRPRTVYPKKYAHGFVVLCFVVVMQSFIMNSHEVFIHIHQGCFAGTGAIVRLPQCQWSKPDGYGKISQCITTTKHSKAKTVCIFLGIYYTILGCNYSSMDILPGGRFKNTNELLNLRALKFSPVNKIHLFQCMGKIFCVEFQRYPLKFHTKYLTHTLKDMIFV